MTFPYKQSSLMALSQLKHLPPESYQVVAEILGLPQRKDDDEEDVDDNGNYVDSESDDESERSFGMTVHPPTPQKSLIDADADFGEMINPYALFLKKPRRKVVIWRPLREEDLKGYDPEATLEMRAARLLDKICKEFCEWLKQLGGDEQIMDEETLKDMFEINFSAEACKATQVIIREMRTVPITVANARHVQDANELEATRKQINEDLKIENKAKRTHAFGRSLPNELRFVPPKNRLSNKWLSCEFIPKDLDTMDVVWDGIMHLDSVQSFVEFLKSYPRKSSKKLLRNLMARKNITKAKSI